MNWFVLSLLGLSPLAMAGVLAWQAWLHHQATARWMRLLAEREGISARLLEPEQDEAKSTPPLDTRRRVSIPVPVGPWSKNAAAK